MKSSKRYSFPAAKKGTQRMVMKTHTKKTKSQAYDNTEYIRHGAKSMKSRRDRETWSIGLKEIITMSENELTQRCIRDELLADKEGEPCPMCGEGALNSLAISPSGSLRNRCSKKGCQCYVSPLHGSPVFAMSKHTDSFKDQCVVLHCLLSGASRSAIRHMFADINHKTIEAMQLRLKTARSLFVHEREKSITFGTMRAWKDVEVDEAVFGQQITAGRQVGDKQRVWEQWAGMIERGRCDSLVLMKTHSGKTATRAPGPGAIKKHDWRPFAAKHLEGRRVVLHTDSAKSYKCKVPGVVHDSVVHCKKRVKGADGRYSWTKPNYVKVSTHKLPGGQKLRTKAGTQIIDRVWRFVRDHLEGAAMVPGSATAAANVRSAQWLYWNRGKDLWLETGVMCRSLREAE